MLDQLINNFDEIYNQHKIMINFTTYIYNVGFVIVSFLDESKILLLKIKTMDLTEIYKFKTSLKRSSNCLTIISHSHITYMMKKCLFWLRIKIDAKKNPSGRINPSKILALNESQKAL